MVLLSHAAPIRRWPYVAAQTRETARPSVKSAQAIKLRPQSEVAILTWEVLERRVKLALLKSGNKLDPHFDALSRLPACSWANPAILGMLISSSLILPDECAPSPHLESGWWFHRRPHLVGELSTDDSSFGDLYPPQLALSS